MTKKLTLLAAALSTVLLGACSSQPTQAEVGSAPQKSSGDEDSKRRSLERKLAIAELRLTQSKLDQDAALKSSQEAVGFAEAELDMAQGKASQFETLDGPNRQARGELDLKRAEDRNTEATEELKQLEIMYDEQDLEDMTAEFVISRGQRNAERAEMSLAIQRKELEALTAHEMPRELRGLKLAVDRKTSDLAKAKADAESTRLKHEIAVLNIESEITDLKEQLEKLGKGGAE